MFTYLLIIVGIVIVAIVEYFSSRWFGTRSSGMGPLPTHYRHLLRPADETPDPETELDDPASTPRNRRGRL